MNNDLYRDVGKVRLKNKHHPASFLISLFGSGIKNSYMSFS